jgi:hypothetical protein
VLALLPLLHQPLLQRQQQQQQQQVQLQAQTLAGRAG